MAVLIEGISVIVRNDSILSKYYGGNPGFLKSVNKMVWISDGELVCVHFMTPADAKKYVDLLIENGLKFKDEDNNAIDITIVDQLKGKLTKSNWIFCGYTNWDGNPDQRIMVCQLLNSSLDEILVPNNWKYEISLTKQALFFRPDDMKESLRFLKTENNIDVFIDTETGKEYFVRRE